MEEQLIRTHLLVVPFPAQGHIAPMMQFSIKLAAQQDFLITFANTQFNHALLKKELQPALHSYKALEGAQGQIRLVEVRDTGRDSGDTTGGSSIVELTESMFSLQPALESLIQDSLKSANPITCLVSDFTQDVANKYKIPRLTFWTASAGMLASAMVVTKYAAKSSPPPPKPDQIIDWVPGVPPLKVCELNSFMQCFDPSDYMFYHGFYAPYSRLHESTWILINTFDELEQASIAALQKDNPTTPIYSVGPLLPAAYFDENHSLRQQKLQNYPHAALWKEDDACIKWLDSQQNASVLYVSFGSIAVFTKSQFHELALGLEASGSPLLWVVRPDLLHGDGSIFPDGYLDRMGTDRVCFVDWSPQLQVLTHPSVGGFLTHCGWNSTMESISAGVPLLGWPYFDDQMLNNRCCIDGWGVGFGFENGLSRQEVEEKVRALMAADCQLRENARRLSCAARRAAESGGSSSSSWRQLVRAIAAASPIPTLPKS